jgi:uncharacterized membrane protein
MDEDLRLILVNMNRRIEALEREIAGLKGRPAVREAVAGPPRVEKERPVEPECPEPKPMEPKPEEVVSTLFEEERRAVKPAGANASLENAIGTKWLGRVGMLAMIFGVGFLLKYSFDNNLIGETGRVMLGMLSGVLFLAAGEYLSRRDDMRLYSRVLTGGGLAILYLSVYAAYSFYKLIPQLPAFAVFAAVTTTGITLSVRYNALVVAMIAMIGGFLTPLMLSTGENRAVELFSYILLLDVGALIVCYRRRWLLLNVLSLVLTILTYLLWHEGFYTPDQQLLAFGITTAFFVLYGVSSLVKGRGFDPYGNLYDHIVTNALILLYLLSFVAQNGGVNEWDLKGFVLGLSVFLMLMAGGLPGRENAAKHVIHCYAGWSVALSVLALLLIFERQWQAIALALETAALCHAGLRLDNRYLRFASYLTGLIVAVLFFRESYIHLAPFEEYLPVINLRFLVCGLLIAVFYVLLFLLDRGKGLLASHEKTVLTGLLILTQVLSVYLLSVEALDYFRFSSGPADLGPVDAGYARQLSLSMVWAAYASVLIGAGMVWKHPALRLLGIGLIAVTVLKVFLFDLSELRTVYRIISFVVLGLILLAVSYFYNRFKHSLFGEDGSK